MKVIKIPYNIECPCTVHTVPEPAEEGCFDQIKKLIEIDWAEIVLTRLRSDELYREFVLIVDECGKLKDQWDARINDRASIFYTGTYYGDPIVGDVVICARQWAPGFGECDLDGLDDLEILSILSKFNE